MFELHSLGVAAAALAQPTNLFLIAFGTFLGLVFGLLPGITSLAAMAILLPFTIGMEPMSGMYLFAGIMGSAPFGGSVTAILFNIPGEPVNAATCFDGYPMTQKGEASRALGISATASALGAVFGLGVLILLLPAVRPIVFAFGPPEFFMMIMLGLVTVSIAAPGNMIKGLVTAGLGVLVSIIGYDPMGGALRFNLGSQNYLWDGVSLVAFFVGIFAVAEVVEYFVKGGTISLTGTRVHTGLKGTLEGVKDVFRNFRVFIQGSVVGTLVGILPGVGGTVANFLSYTIAMQTSKHPERFGKGSAEGVVAAESANNAKDGGALLPTVAFGIPGSAETALLLGALILHGFNPGPLFIRDNMQIVWALILGLLISNIIASTLGLLGADLLTRVTTLNVKYLVPTILVVSLIGAYADRENIWDVLMAIVAGLLGYGLVRFGFPIITLVIGFVLGRLAERSFLQSLQISMDPWIFFKRPISLTLFLLIIVFFIFPIMRRWKRSYTAREKMRP